MKGSHEKRWRLSQGLTIIYEDPDLIVVDKPAGLLSVAAGAEKNKTVYWILSEYLRRKGEKRRVAVVHRLDRDTSGVMVFAKSEEIKRALMDHWDQAVAERRYLALAEGDFAADEGIIDAPLGEDRGGRVVVVREGGQPAVTRWRVLERRPAHTLLALDLETGRRNQIRAHLAYLGHPVAGDKKYFCRTNPAGRLALHAETLVLTHPRSGKQMTFNVPVPPSFGGRGFNPSRGK